MNHILTLCDIGYYDTETKLIFDIKLDKEKEEFKKTLVIPEGFKVELYKDALKMIFDEIHDSIIAYEIYMESKDKFNSSLEDLFKSIKPNKYIDCPKVSFALLHRKLFNSFITVGICYANLAVLYVLGHEDLIITYQEIARNFIKEFRESGVIEQLPVEIMNYASDFKNAGDSVREKSIFYRSIENFEYLQTINEDFRNLEIF